MAFIRRALSRIGVDKDDHLKLMEEGLSSVTDHGADEALEGELLTSTIPNQDSLRSREKRPATPPNATNSSEWAQAAPTKVRIVEISSPLAIRVSI